MNFLRDYVLERNFLQLSPDKSFTDGTQTKWANASVSITGKHTRAVNSDSFADAKDGSKVLGVLADGITRQVNPIDMEAYEDIGIKLKAKIIDEDQAELEKKMLYNKDANTFGSHYLAKSLTNAIAGFNKGLLLKTDLKVDSTIDADAQETAIFLKKNPDHFWKVLKQLNQAQIIVPNTGENLYDALANRIDETETLQKYVTSLGLSGFTKAIRNKGS